MFCFAPGTHILVAVLAQLQIRKRHVTGATKFAGFSFVEKISYKIILLQLIYSAWCSAFWARMFLLQPVCDTVTAEGVVAC